MFGFPGQIFAHHGFGRHGIVTIKGCLFIFLFVVVVLVVVVVVMVVLVPSFRIAYQMTPVAEDHLLFGEAFHVNEGAMERTDK